MERFEDTATEDEEEEFIAMQAVDRDTVDEVASEIEEEELPLESKEPISLEKPKNIAAHPKSEEERKIVEDFNALQQRMAAMLARRTDETAEEQHVSDALNEIERAYEKHSRADGTVGKSRKKDTDLRRLHATNL